MLFGVCRGLDDYAAMECAKKAGIDYFETGFGCLANFDDEKFNKGKEKLESLGLPCLIANGFIPGDMKLVGDDVDYKALEDYLVRGFKRAEEIGVKIIVFGSGGARSYPEGFSPEKAKEQFVYFLKEYAAPMAKKAGCIIVIEPLRFCESSMIHMVSDGVEMSRLSGADNVFGLADLYHVYGNNDDIDAMKAFWLQLKLNEQQSRGVRLKDMPDEWFEIPSDEAMKNSIVTTIGVFICNRYINMRSQVSK